MIEFILNIVFNVIELLSNLIILRLSWFKIHNPNIDWPIMKIFSMIDFSPKAKIYLIGVHKYIDTYI
jgi:hypothetical protein